MAIQYNKRLRLIMYGLKDLFILILAFGITNSIIFAMPVFSFNTQYQQLLQVFSVLWIVSGFVFNVWAEHQGWKFYRHFLNVSSALLMFVFLVLGYIVLFKISFISRYFLITFFMIYFAILNLSWFVKYQFLTAVRRRGKNYKRVLVLGSLPKNNTDSWSVLNPEWGYKIEDIIDEDMSSKDYILKLGEYLSSKSYDEILITNPAKFGDDLESIIDFSENFGLRIKIVPKFMESFQNKVSIDYLNGTPVMNVRHEPLKYFHNRLLKRAFDLSVALVFMVTVYWWLHLIIALAIKLSSKGPVLFKQKRIGIDNKPFMIYKFRTMAFDTNEKSSNDGKAQITKVGDSRITKIGQLLRMTNLDEFPQFLNVLFGDMSIVGPRPHMEQEDIEIQNKVEKYRIRQFVKPGITGWAQVNGLRGGTEDMKLMTDRIKHDIFYIEKWSSLLDLKIIWQTGWQMITLNTHAH